MITPRWVKRWFGAMVATVSAVFTLACIKLAEPYLFPVVSDWRVTRVSFDGSAVVMEGVFHKHRVCLLEYTDIRVRKTNGNILLYQIKGTDPALGVNTATGHTTWGPMRFTVSREKVELLTPGDVFEVVATHRCHALWPQETVYGTLPVERVLEVLK